MTVDEAIKVIEEFKDILRMCDIPIYDNEEEAFKTLIKAALNWDSVTSCYSFTFATEEFKSMIKKLEEECE